jgi:hypothetical protein
MRRKTFDALLASGGLVVAAVLLIAGGLLLWAHSFANDNVHSQLAAQKIAFPTTAAISAQHSPEMTQYLMPYAGQQVTDGRQAQVFADHYIKVHLSEVAGGQTYSQVSGQYLALQAQNPDDPKLPALGAQRQTLFMGETLRGLLLNAYAFWKMGQIAFVAAIVSFATAAVMTVLAALGFWHLRRVPPDAQLLPKLGAPPRAPAKA